MDVIISVMELVSLSVTLAPLNYFSHLILLSCLMYFMFLPCRKIYQPFLNFVKQKHQD